MKLTGRTWSNVRSPRDRSNSMVIPDFRPRRNKPAYIIHGASLDINKPTLLTTHKIKLFFLIFCAE